MLGIHWAGLDLSPSGKSRETHLQGGQLLERLLPPPRAGRRCSDSRASEPVGQEGFPGCRTGEGGGGAGTLRAICGPNGLNSL